MSTVVDVLDPARVALVNKNLDLAAGFLRAIVANPAILDDIPNGVMLKLLPEEDPDLIEQNIAIGLKAVRAGRDVYFRHVRVADFPPRPELTEAQQTWSEHAEWENEPDENAGSLPMP